MRINIDGSDELGEKINKLTLLLEVDIEKLKSAHNTELEKIKNSCSEGIKSLNADFKNQCNEWKQFHKLQAHRILEMEDQVSYLKELLTSQRLMMEHNLVHIKELEQKINFPAA